MTLTLTEARLEVYTAPDHDTIDFIIPGEDIESIETTERAGEPADSGKITVDNRDGKYTVAGTDTPLDIDDRLVFKYKVSGDSSWCHGGDFLSTEDLDIDVAGGGDSTISLNVVDYVFGILKMRKAYYSDSSKPLSGSDDAHLDTILSRRAPEVDLGGIKQIPTDIDYSARGLDLTRVVDDLVGIGATINDGMITYGDRRQLIFKPLSDLERQYTGEALFSRADFKGSGGNTIDGEIINSVRVDGGIDDNNIGDEIEESSLDHYVSVNESSRLITQINVRKATIPQIEIYTRGNAKSDDGIRVRVQASNDAGDGPIAPNDKDSDIITGQNRKVALDDEGWTTWRLGRDVDYAIPERTPWLIVDGPGEDGYEVGVTADNTPLYRIHFSKPVVANPIDPSSLSSYLQHEAHISNDGLQSVVAAQDRGRAELERNSLPGNRLSPGKCRTKRAHSLELGDVIECDFPIVRAEGEHVVIERRQKYNGPNLETEIDLAGIDQFNI